MSAEIESRKSNIRPNTYPAGFRDVVSIPKTNENFRLLYDTKGRFRLHSIRDEEADVWISCMFIYLITVNL
ncbi:hypothetical protein BRARA_E00661 [Brassica rapa]|uniref:Small ribosomal subunit protein eS4 central region domain-containing protein n=1 Tax=Brassica campestris TaxID=3711 RepID=A0A397Z791_BRACM|nr:hypothetical protein BRARA_E00661 [Brassica rapa]